MTESAVEGVVAFTSKSSLVRAALGRRGGNLSSEGLAVCLYGEDAAAVFALTDRQGTSLTIDDGTAVRDVFIRPHLPGYRSYGVPCP